MSLVVQMCVTYEDDQCIEPLNVCYIKKEVLVMMKLDQIDLCARSMKIHVISTLVHID